MSEFVFVVAATNKIESLDLSLRRSNRFEHEIEVTIPSPHDRAKVKLIFLYDEARKTYKSYRATALYIF